MVGLGRATGQRWVRVRRRATSRGTAHLQPSAAQDMPTHSLEMRKCRRGHVGEGSQQALMPLALEMVHPRGPAHLAVRVGVGISREPLGVPVAGRPQA